MKFNNFDEALAWARIRMKLLLGGWPEPAPRPTQPARDNPPMYSKEELQRFKADEISSDRTPTIPTFPAALDTSKIDDNWTDTLAEYEQAFPKINFRWKNDD